MLDERFDVYKRQQLVQNGHDIVCEPELPTLPAADDNSSDAPDEIHSMGKYRNND